jgi:tetratricopeptide (TPR) repeat protein
MSELRFEDFTMPAAALHGESPLPLFAVSLSNLVDKSKMSPSIPREDSDPLGIGRYPGCLPYQLQDHYDRVLRPRAFRVAVLENDILRAMFLLELGGRLWSLRHKPTGRELLHAPPVFQPGNLAIRNAWFAGGVEWNSGWPGHTPFTCSPLFAARAAMDDGTPVLRMYEWERVRRLPYQIDAFLPNGSRVLFVRVRLANLSAAEVPAYWWSNIAVPEDAGSRVLVPADSAYRFDYVNNTLGEATVPVCDGIDGSYATNHKRAGDAYYRIPNGRQPWIASLDREGKGLFQTSTLRLKGRKLFVWGMGAGGRRWQDFLCTAERPYIEIQAGLTRVQSGCAVLPPNTDWDWLEAYGMAETDADCVHGRDWLAAYRETEARIVAQVPLERIEGLLAATRPMAERPPLGVLQKGSGWGALEAVRRKAAGEPPAFPPSLVFGEETLGVPQEPWLELLRTGRLPEPATTETTASFMVQSEWREMLKRSIAAGRSDHWFGWYHMGVILRQEDNTKDAVSAWKRSMALKPSAWACRNLAVIAKMEKRLDETADLLRLANDLLPGFRPLAIEYAQAMVDAGRFTQCLEFMESMPGPLRDDGRIRLIEGRAMLGAGRLDGLLALLRKGFDIADMREGETSASELWFAMHEQMIAGQEGKLVDEEIKARVRRDFPVPAHLDFRMS